MTENTVRVANELGIHLRAAARIVAITSRSKARVWVGTTSPHGDVMVDGKSLLGITSLLARQGTDVIVRADGEGEAEVVDRVLQLIASDFAE